MGDSFSSELVKALLGALFTLAVTWIVGERLTSRWAVWQKRREIDLATTTGFYDLYGEFVTLRRMWRHTTSDLQGKERADLREELLRRAITAEGKLESILVKLATERVLSPEEITALGHFRRAFRTVRLQIVRDEEIPWNRDSEEYRRIKQLACDVALLLPGYGPESVSRIHAGETLVKITAVSEAEYHNTALAKPSTPSPARTT
jgi:hypothetical protein